MPEPVEVVVVEDEPKTLRNIVRLLASYPEFRVVGSAVSGQAAVEIIHALQPQLVLLDLELPDFDGFQVTRMVKADHPDIEILILTSFEDELKVYQAIQAGAAGYLVKRVAPDKIRQGILEVMNGGTVIESRLARRFWNFFKSVQGSSSQEEEPILNRVERDVLQMVAQGLTNQETGQVLSLQRRTVRTHMSHIYKKLGTSSRTEAVMIALQKGWITL